MILIVFSDLSLGVIVGLTRSSQVEDHLCLFLGNTRTVAKYLASRCFGSCDPEAVDTIISQFYMGLCQKFSGKLPAEGRVFCRDDVRVGSVLAYFVATCDLTFVLTRTFAEQMELGIYGDNSEGGELLRQGLYRMLAHCAEKPGESVRKNSEYLKWHRMYHSFRELMFAFTRGVFAFHETRYF